jgi:hypothetical protein
MKQSEQLTDSQKIDLLNQRLKRMEVSQHIQTGITILVFLGVVSFGVLVNKFRDGFR